LPRIPKEPSAPSAVDVETPIPERREYSWEKNKIYLQGRFRYDESLKQGFVTDL